MQETDNNTTTISRDTTRVLDRRMAPRTIEIVQRLAPQHPQIAAVAEKVLHSAQGYIELYDGALPGQAERRAEIEARNEDIGELHGATRGWVSVLVGDVPGFVDDFNADARVATDVIADAERLMEFVRARMGSEGGALPYAEEVLTSLAAKVETAAAAATEAHRARVEMQQYQARVREAATAFRKELVKLRRIMRSVIGRSSLDYQRLRLRRVEVTLEPTTDDVAGSEATDEPSGVHDLPPDIDTAVNE